MRKFQSNRNLRVAKTSRTSNSKHEKKELVIDLGLPGEIFRQSRWAAIRVLLRYCHVIIVLKFYCVTKLTLERIRRIQYI